MSRFVLVVCACLLGACALCGFTLLGISGLLDLLGFDVTGWWLRSVR